MYEPVDPKASFPSMEESVLAFWKDRDVFKRSISERDGSPEYVFYDGPPFATGLPHFGHFVPGTIKDVIPRYKTMKGFKVERRFGWDCHGLPVENLIEKELGLDSKTDIERFGVANFNEACRSSVQRYVKEWRTIMTRAGRWVDFDNDYKTMDPDYMESIWWVVKNLWDQGLVYEGHYILPYCPRCSTVLSNHELALGGYKDVHDPAITIKFKVLEAPAGLEGLADGSTYLLAWTTTPWTLPSNLALCLGPDIDYVLVKDGAERYLLAESRLSAYYKEGQLPEIVWRRKGSELVGVRYEPLFPYFAELAAQKAFRTWTGGHVTTEDGTGIVHTAPGFGEEDHAVLKGTGVPTVCPIDAECKFTAEVSDYAGRFVKDCDKDIMERLKAEGKLAKRDQILHAYPHCWRCDHPLIYRAVSSWFVKIDPIKPKFVATNQQIHWEPEHIKNGRFGKWLDGARDWAISRSRYWGNPLPIWKCPDCGKTVCVGSRDELEQRSGVRLTDLHKHFVDEVTMPCSCGATMSRIPDVLDCWFESGSMPYAQVHYPFENKEHFESHFPADFISESLDQTRGWFYSLTVLAAALFDRPAYQNCIVSGMVLAADGKKMSKSQRNYTDPMEAINKFGADALRLYLMASPVLKADDLCFTDDGVRDVVKSILLPLWSAYGFFVTYANIDGVEPGEAPAAAVNPMDRWILSKCETMVRDVGAGLEAYTMQSAIAPMLDFIDALNNWYIRRSRRRFWRSENDGDKVEAYSTLYRALKRLTLCMAPFTPFVTEAMWRNLRRDGEPESVHLASYPEYDERYRDEDLEWKMAAVRKAVTMGRSLRYQHNLKIRQPLAAVHLVTKDARERAVLLEMEDIVRDELNVKEVVFREDEEELVEYQAKANFRALGKELGKDMKEGAALVERLEPRQIASLLSGSSLVVEIAGKQVELTKDKVDVRRVEKASLRVVNEGTLTVALDAEITQALLDEGNARDLVRGVQTLRKDSGLSVTDRIELSVHGGDALRRSFDAFGDFVSGETLAVALRWEETPGMVDVEAGDDTWKIAIKKA
ncbi:MAG TPA: isoleucine--tRNA ligase [Spirochaetia bacterium]|nr:isoleucine--tRNA ligase [Spirochaetales bacterium]HRW23541.1 isoleucine--tRNA ligase [Spirochaetia bacterium]